MLQDTLRLLAVSLLFGTAAWGGDLSDAKIKAAIIRESQAGYSGSCPCPDNVDRAGRRCGKRSAYLKPGGASPLCYPADVTAEMIRKYKSGTASEK